jgi:hypothetical protein
MAILPGLLNWCSNHWDVAVVCLSPQNAGAATGKVATTWALPITQAQQGIANLVMLFGYAHASYLMVKVTPSPDGVDNDGGRHTGSHSAATESDGMAMTFTKCMDESGQGSKRAVAKAVPHSLKIRPDIHDTIESSSKRPSC